MPAYVSLKGSTTKDEFERLYRKCKDAKQARRYHAMYLSFSYDWKEIAEILCIDYDTVLEWAKLYNEYGLEGLALGKSPGRTSSLTDEQLDEVKKAVQQCPRDLGFKFSNWTAPRLAKWIAGKFDVLLSDERTRQILHCIGFSFVKPTYSYILADRKERRAFLADFKEVAECSNAFMFEDESTVEQHPSLHGMWVLKGTKAKIRTFGNHIKRHVFAAVNPITGKAVNMVAKRLTADAFIGFLVKLLNGVTKPFTLILDNSPCHRAKSVMQFLEQHKSRITVLWLPKYSPDMNPSEQVWKDMKLNVCHNYLFGNANRLSWGIRCYFRQLKPEKVMSLCSPDYLLG
ncbi:MAG: IS630 family transposase [Planctomycetota bacterium]|nr:IS630 family transposase [Planctomycetota bacterium]